MSKLIGDLIFAVLLLIFGIAYYDASTRIPSNMLEDPVGASGFPRLISAVVIVLSLVLLVQSVKALRRSRIAAAQTPAGSLGADGDKEAFAKFCASALLFATITMFLVLFNVAGYIISVAFLLLAVFLQSGTKFGWMPVLTAVLGPVVFHLFFGELLGVRLPAGILQLPF